MNAFVALVGKTDDEGEMPGYAVGAHFLSGYEDLLDGDVLANAPEHLRRARFDTDQQPTQTGRLEQSPELVRHACPLVCPQRSSPSELHTE